ncbi:MAG: AAA family ATPase [Candidatus Obscuribacterales bacterium]|nr:AAA family ATPase [Candidatus Obscuribacterales bacterium]MBX9723834.1 AAA family ATPase [Candidatus Obscuribacterales bacterium]
MSLSEDSYQFVNLLLQFMSNANKPLASVLWRNFSVGDSFPQIAKEIEAELLLLFIIIKRYRGVLNEEQLAFANILLQKCCNPGRTLSITELDNMLSDVMHRTSPEAYPARIIVALKFYDVEHNTDFADQWKKLIIAISVAMLGSNHKSQKFLSLWSEISGKPLPQYSVPLARNRRILRQIERMINTAVEKSSFERESYHASDVAESELGQALSELNAMIGLKTLKEQISELIALVRNQRLREAKHLHNAPMSYHMVFAGNPGTGKTQVARITAKIFKAIGILKSGHLIEVDRSKLIAEYVGQTAIKTTKVVEEALGGVLFIDEAYSLMNELNDPFGQECIDTLVKLMEDHRDNLIVIAAGYTTKMSQFINANPGLQSRFPLQFIFDDYSEDELIAIFKKLAQDGEYELSKDLEDYLPTLFCRLLQQKTSNFANARECRNLLEKAKRKQAIRLSKLINPNRKSLRYLKLEDVEESDDEQDQKRSLQEIRADLNKLVGLKSIKEAVDFLINNIQAQNMRASQNLPRLSVNNHLVFAGNPGTGKTTVARLLGSLYKELGILSKGHFVEVDRSSLIGVYMGQTAATTKRQVESALGGVLFIDEVYALVEGEQDEYGLECINTLVKLIEDYREQMVVIIAGYSSKMNLFINSNPGLKSRFQKTFFFEDYEPQELFDIFQLFCNDKSFILSTSASRLLKEELSEIFRKRNEQFGNARVVRNLFNAVVEMQSSRVIKLTNPSRVELMTLDEPDVFAALNQKNRMPE